jgi:hypothetical protein
MDKTTRKPISKAEITALRHLLGIGAMLLDLNNVDLSLGRTITKKSDGSTEVHMWTKKGNRIEIVSCSDGGSISSISKEPDPNKPEKL